MVTGITMVMTITMVTIITMVTVVTMITFLADQSDPSLEVLLYTGVVVKVEIHPFEAVQ